MVSYPSATAIGPIRHAYTVLTDDLNRSIETLVRYLSDRRPKLKAALENVGITPESQSHLASPLSEASVEDLFALPNARLSALTPEQLLRFAQIVDTALYKSYMIIRPALLGSLCRVANWCEVSEVEDDLRARKVCRLYYVLRSASSDQPLSLSEIRRNEGPISRKEDAFESIRPAQRVSTSHGRHYRRSNNVVITG